MFIIKSIHNDKFFKSRCLFALMMTVVFLMSVTSVFAAPWSDTVTIIDGSKTYTVYTDTQLVKEIIGQEGIEISDADMIYPAVNDKISDDHTIVIKRLKHLDVQYEGKALSYWTDAETYREFISKGTISADFDDIYDVDLDDRLSSASNNKMNIIKVDFVTEYEEEAIPYTSKTVYDDKAPKGQRTVITAGVNGINAKSYEIKYHDGVQVSRTYTGEFVKQQPVEEIVSEGTNQQAIFVNGQAIPYKKALTCQATAYDLSFESCGKWPGSPGYGITASGTYAKPGTVAVDPRVIPLGTKMFIVSTDGSYVYGYCTAEDTGGAIKGNKVDLFYNTRSECMQFGRRSVMVYIL